eukprot:COSAG06_NODE_671_length_13206_cov_477.269474_13_plen_66_part_00
MVIFIYKWLKRPFSLTCRLLVVSWPSRNVVPLFTSTYFPDAKLNTGLVAAFWLPLFSRETINLPL